MNIKIISIIIIFFSFLSGLLGSYIFIKTIGIGTNSINNNEIIKNGKVINITDIESEITNLVKIASPSVVNIIIKKDVSMYRSDPWGFFRERVGSVEQKVGGGSGFFVSKDGIIMTNKHVVGDQNAKYSVITNDGTEYEASVLALDNLTDLAIIKIDGKGKIFNTLEIIEDEKYIKIGQFVVAIGNALAEFQNSVSFGVISGKGRSIEAGGYNGSEKLIGLLQTDAAINPGNSGGPLINLNGEIIGINTAIAGNSQGVGFSIPISKKRIEYILDSIKKYGTIKRPFIGINYIPIDREIQAQLGLLYDYGAYIPEDNNSIIKDSTAYKAGIKQGDIILEIDDKKIDINNNIADLIQNKIPGDKIKVKILTKDKIEKVLFLELGEY